MSRSGFKLHSLILGLVYAQELDDYKDVRANLIKEAVAVSDVYNDARRYGGDITVPVQHELSRYVATVVNEEWEMLGKHKGLSPQAWQEWEGVYDVILAFGNPYASPGKLEPRALERLLQGNMGATLGQ